MKKLSKDTFNEVRSFLSFKELHLSRNVSKSWANIEKVEKQVESIEDLQSPFACFSNLYDITVTIEEYSRDVYLIMRCLSESRDSLKYISIDMNDDISGIDRNSIPWVIPMLPNVESIYAASDLALDKLLLRKCLGIHNLYITLRGQEFNEDLRQHSNLKMIFISSDRSNPVTLFNVSCLSMVKPSTIRFECTCHSIADLVHILPMKSHIDLVLNCMFPSFNIKIKLIPTKTIFMGSLKFLYPQNRQHDLHRGMESFTRMLNLMKESGCSTWTITLKGTAKHPTYFDLLYALGHSGLFSNDAILKGCCKFKET